MLKFTVPELSLLLWIVLLDFGPESQAEKENPLLIACSATNL